MKTEYRVRSTEGWEDRAKVQIGAELLCKGEKVNTKNGRDVASPRPPWLGGQGEALPLPAGGAREIGQHVVLSLPEASTRFSTPYCILCTPRGFAAPLPN